MIQAYAVAASGRMLQSRSFNVHFHNIDEGISIPLLETYFPQGSVRSFRILAPSNNSFSAPEVFVVYWNINPVGLPDIATGVVFKASSVGSRLLDWADSTESRSTLQRVMQM